MRELLQKTLAYRMVEGKVESGRRGHAYLLLSEDEGTLRKTLRIFASALYHGDKRKSALIERESFSDCLFFPEEGKKPSVEDAGRILDESIVRPIEGDVKLFVFDKFHLANAPTQNKLLKVLEEPPEGVCFLLGATSAYPVLPTILSRVEKLEIPLFSESEIEAYLARNYPQAEKEKRHAAAAAAGGLPSRAEEFLTEGDFESLLSLAFRALDVEPSAIPALSAEIEQFGKKEDFLSVFKLVCRDALMRTLGKSPLLERSAKTAHTKESLVSAIDLVSDTEGKVKLNANYRQAVEILLAAIYKEKKKWLK